MPVSEVILPEEAVLQEKRTIPNKINNNIWLTLFFINIPGIDSEKIFKK
jgi:hypothetical protein